MNILKRFLFFLISFLVIIFVWVGFNIYLRYSEVNVQKEFYGIEIDYSASRVDEDLGLDADVVTIELLRKPIQEKFEKEGLDLVVEKIDEFMVVETEVFHNLREEAILYIESDLSDDVNFEDELD